MAHPSLRSHKAATVMAAHQPVLMADMVDTVDMAVGMVARHRRMVDMERMDPRMVGDMGRRRRRMVDTGRRRVVVAAAGVMRRINPAHDTGSKASSCTGHMGPISAVGSSAALCR